MSSGSSRVSRPPVENLPFGDFLNVFTSGTNCVLNTRGSTHSAMYILTNKTDNIFNFVAVGVKTSDVRVTVSDISGPAFINVPMSSNNITAGKPSTSVLQDINVASKDCHSPQYNNNSHFQQRRPILDLFVLFRF